MKEIFKDIPNYEGLYQISNYGRVKTSKRERVKPGIKKTFINKKNGYVQVMLYKDAKGKTYSVHRLVAEVFIPKIEGKYHIDHIDHDKTNNHIDNLRWCTPQDNHENMTTNRKVAQYDLSGNLIKIYSTTKQASANTGCTHISEICRGNRKTGNGYIFKYVD